MQNANEASLSEQEASQVTNLRTQSLVQGMNLLGCRYTYLLLLSRAVYLPPSLPTSWPNPAARPDSPWGPTPREPSASSLLRQSTSLPPAHLTTPPSAPGRKRTKREGAERNIKQKLRSLPSSLRETAWTRLGAAREQQRPRLGARGDVSAPKTSRGPLASARFGLASDASYLIVIDAAYSF